MKVLISEFPLTYCFVHILYQNMSGKVSSMSFFPFLVIFQIPHFIFYILASFYIVNTPNYFDFNWHGLAYIMFHTSVRQLFFWSTAWYLTLSPLLIRDKVCKARMDHIPSNLLRAVFHKFYLVRPWILCSI